jgi:hypothetical protein
VKQGEEEGKGPWVIGERERGSLRKREREIRREIEGEIS